MHLNPQIKADIILLLRTNTALNMLLKINDVWEKLGKVGQHLFRKNCISASM